MSSDQQQNNLAGNHQELQKKPSFSIRKYVDEQCKKDVSIGWPFGEKYLQLCLKHGISDFFPPFEGLSTSRDDDQPANQGMIPSSSGTSSCTNQLKNKQVMMSNDLNVNKDGDDDQETRLRKMLAYSNGMIVMNNNRQEITTTSAAVKQEQAVSDDRLDMSLMGAIGYCHGMIAFNNCRDDEIVAATTTGTDLHAREDVPLSTSDQGGERRKRAKKLRSIYDIYAEAKPCTVDCDDMD